MPTTEAEFSAPKVTRVAVGVIVRTLAGTGAVQVCIALRPKHLHKGGLWEFPGGKIEQGETAASALERELREELGIGIRTVDEMMDIPWEYQEKVVHLEVMKVTAFEGEVSGREGQRVEWVSLDQLENYQFPEANEAIIEQLLGLGK